MAGKQTFELTEDLTSRLDSFAARSGSSSAQIVADAVSQYITNQERWRSQMASAMQDVENGAGYDGDEVLEWIDSWGTSHEKPRPSRHDLKA